MDFQSRILKTPHKQRIIIEIDILGDEVNLDNYQNIADRLTDLLCQDSWLANPPEKLTFNTKVSLQLLPQKTHDQVQLPPLEMTVKVIGSRK